MYVVSFIFFFIFNTIFTESLKCFREGVTHCNLFRGFIQTEYVFTEHL